MTDTPLDTFETEAAARLTRAEQKGLRLAIAVRTIITGAALAWYGAAPLVFDGFEPRFAAIVILMVFTAVGVGHLLLIKDDAPLQPKISEGTALVMDIAGFTAFSARHPPRQVIAVLDAFLAEAADAVAAERGIVMSYLGDGLLVTFNAPVAVPDPAAAALRTARALHEVAQAHQFIIRISIAHGALATGTIGADDRKNFTVYGDAVNLAARLEGACKDMGVGTLINAETAAQLPAHFSGSARAPVHLKGLSSPTEVYTPD